MADQGLASCSAFQHWTPLVLSQLKAEARESLTMASFATSKDKKEALMAAIRAAYDVELPQRPGRAQGRGIDFVWAGPDQWLAIAERKLNRDIEIELKPILAGIASVVDQSDGRIVIRISGPRARDVLAKGVPVDLDPRVFPVNGVAITHASHIGVILWQVDGAPTYEMALFRSYADSFAHWLLESAAEYASPGA